MKSITVTTQRAINYGAVLQAYALQKIQQEKGIHNEILMLPRIGYGYRKLPKKINHAFFVALVINIKGFIYKKDVNKVRAEFERFVNERLQTTRSYKSIGELLQMPPEADVYICGSDQVFGLRNEQKVARLLQFGEQKITRCSYAASLEEYDWSDEEKSEFSGYLAGFDAVSVREKYAKEYIGTFSDKECEVHMDPVFAVEQSFFDDIAVAPKINEPYVLVYPLISNKETQRLINRIKSETGYKIVSVRASRSLEYKVDKSIYTASPEEFLGLIKHSKAVITTSFHGTAFSILYQKPFYTLIKNYKSQRITDLLKMLSLEDRIYQPEQKINLKVDFSKAMEVIEIERERTRQYFDRVKLLADNKYSK